MSSGLYSHEPSTAGTACRRSASVSRMRRRAREPREDLAGRGERRCRLRRSPERHQAAPPTKQSVPLFVGHAEVVPAAGGVGEAGRRRFVLAAGLAPPARRPRHDVLVKRQRCAAGSPRALGEPPGQLVVAGGQRRPYRLRRQIEHAAPVARRRQPFAEQTPGGRGLTETSRTAEAASRARPGPRDSQLAAVRLTATPRRARPRLAPPTGEDQRLHPSHERRSQTSLALLERRDELARPRPARAPTRPGHGGLDERAR